MPTFKVAGKVTISCFTEIEADTEAEALEIAKRRELAEFQIDGSYPVEETWHFDADGTPFEIRIEQ